MIMTPIARPAAKALSAETGKPTLSPTSFIKGASDSAAKKP